MKQWKHEKMEDYYEIFLQLCAIIPQQPNDVYFKETLREGLRNKFKLAIIGMPKSIIVEVANSAREIEEKMPTPRRSRRSQPLSDSEY
jgi:hypothetical protein